MRWIPVSFVMIILFSVSVFAVDCTVGAQNKDDCVIQFKDGNLETAVKQSLKLGVDEKVTLGKVKDITLFTVISFKKIKDLSGMEFFTNLQDFYLYNHLVIDVRPLSNLINLKVLSLHNNTVVDISALSGLTDLNHLYLGHNQITDLSPLKNLVNLEELDVRSNVGLPGDCISSQYIEGKENVKAFLDKCLAIQLSKGSVCQKDADCVSGKCWTIKSIPSIGICDGKLTPTLRNEIVASKKYGKQCSKDTECKSNALRCWNVQGDIGVCDLKNEQPYVNYLKMRIKTELENHTTAQKVCTNPWYIVNCYYESQHYYTYSFGVNYDESPLLLDTKKWEKNLGYSFACDHGDVQSFLHTNLIGENDWVSSPLFFAPVTGMLKFALVAAGKDTITLCTKHRSIFTYDILNDDVSYVYTVPMSLSADPGTPYIEDSQGLFPPEGKTCYGVVYDEEAAYTTQDYEYGIVEGVGASCVKDEFVQDSFQHYVDEVNGKKSILKEITTSSSADIVGSVAGGIATVPENCNVLGDEDQDGKWDCEDADCKGFIQMTTNKEDILCFKGQSNVCGKNSPVGTTLVTDSYEALCYKNYPYYTWAECTADGTSQKKGLHGLSKPAGTMIAVAGKNYLCGRLGDSDRWMSCASYFPYNWMFSGYLCNPDGTWIEGGCPLGMLSVKDRYLCTNGLWKECTNTTLSTIKNKKFLCGIGYVKDVPSWEICITEGQVSRDGQFTCVNGQWQGAEFCTNGNDDDIDGTADCLDPDCFNPATVDYCFIQGAKYTETEINSGKFESKEVVCGDEADNDKDGKSDCSDDDCKDDFNCKKKQPQEGEGKPCKKTKDCNAGFTCVKPAGSASGVCKFEKAYDKDNDGVEDTNDKCLNTPSTKKVDISGLNTKGCMIGDSNKDDVVDGKDISSIKSDPKKLWYGVKDLNQLNEYVQNVINNWDK